jgi:hypothetical protein
VIRVVTGVRDGGSPAPVGIELDEHGRGQAVLLDQPPEEPEPPEVRRIAEPIALSPIETERSFRLWRKQLTHNGRMAREWRATRQLHRSQRWLQIARHRFVARPVKVRSRAAPRPRSTGSARGRDRPRKPDDDLDALPPRCPRCGRLAVPVPGSALWSCDYCLAASRERLVAHEFERVLAEAERTTKDAA